MKKLLIILLMGLVIAASCFGVRGEDGGRKLTLMIYMCGSNLESAYGSATADIREMLEAGVGRDTAVLIMTGGAESWGLGLDAAQAVITEIGARGRRIVWRSDQMNMGEPETLSWLLRYGRENYPARDYALILWDHGGGPLEGVCWDELFSMDNLSLTELTGALDGAGLEKKLSWIGFDACLMSSLEVAKAVSPYAEYMIASQETEPAYGWNYSFLREIENDENGAETGKRIVDAFFAGHEDSKDVLTMACVDLDRAAETAEAMSAFFAPIGEGMSEENFAALSGLRMSSTGFGKAVRGVGDDGYDLVDAFDLISRLDGESGSGEALRSMLEEAVVYSRSNEKGANGLSLYHPYANKEKYLEKWRESYRKLNFSAGYSRYVSAFGDLLTGAELTKWAGLETRYMGLDQNGYSLFSLQLTKEQAANFASAQLMILKSGSFQWELDDGCELVYTGSAAMDESGLVTGAYTGRALYLEEEDGSLGGPLSFLYSGDGDAVVIAYYVPESEPDLTNMQGVLYYLNMEEESERPTIERIRVYDSVTESYTNRLAFTEDGYRMLVIWSMDRLLPETDENGALPAYMTWDTNTNTVSYRYIGLPSQWGFRFSEDQLTGNQLFAMFQITDVQQNVYCSPPIPVPNDSLTPLSVTTGGIETEEYTLGLRGYVNSSALSAGVELELSVTNKTDREAQYRGDPVIVNGRRLISTVISMSVPAHTTRTQQFKIKPEELVGIEDIESLSFTLELRRDAKDYSMQPEEIPILFQIAEGDVSAIVPRGAPLAELSQDGIVLRLLSLAPHDYGGFNAFLYIENHREEKYTPDSEVLINGIQVKTRLYREVPPGMERVVEFQMLDDVRLEGEITLPTAREAGLQYVFLVDHVQERHSLKSISEITLATRTSVFHGMVKELFSLRLNEPWPIRYGKDPTAYLDYIETILPPQMEDPSRAERILLAENNQYAAYLNQAVLSNEGIALCLEFVNHTDHPLTIYVENGTVNGSPVNFYYQSKNEFIVLPGASLMASLTMGTKDDLPSGMEIEGFSITVRSDDQGETEPVCIACPPGSKLGSKDSVWLNLGEMTVQPVRTPDVEEPGEPEEVRAFDREISLPENAAQYRRWLEAPLTEDQAAQVKDGMLALVRFTGEEEWQLVTLQSTCLNENGRPGAWFSGLIACPESDRQIYWYTVQETTNGPRMRGRLHSTMSIRPDNYKNSVTFKKLEFVLDYEKNTAVIGSYEQEGDLFSYQSDMHWAWIREMTAEPFYNEDGSMGYLGQFIVHDGENPWYGSEEARLNKHPLKIALRPIGEEDEIYIVFAFENRDGTGYSLPPIPYSP